MQPFPTGEREVDAQGHRHILKGFLDGGGSDGSGFVIIENMAYMQLQVCRAANSWPANVTPPEVLARFDGLPSPFPGNCKSNLSPYFRPFSRKNVREMTRERRNAMMN